MVVVAYVDVGGVVGVVVGEVDVTHGVDTVGLVVFVDRGGVVVGVGVVGVVSGACVEMVV